MVITRRLSAISLTVLVLGSSTSMPDCRMGAVIMKMISSTSTTSTKGTILMSESEVPVWRASSGMATRLLKKSVPGELSVILFDLRAHLHGEIVHARGQLLDVVQVEVVGHHRRDGCEQPGRGGDERLGNPRGHNAQAGRTGAAQAGEGVHDAPDGAEQADERRHRAGGGQPGHPLFEAADLVGGDQLHGHRDRVGALERAVRIV